MCVIPVGQRGAQGPAGLPITNGNSFLQIIKDFYLLGRGELFQAFIDTAQHMLKTPPTAVTEHGNCPGAWEWPAG